jgi:hypothetical protein
VGIVESVVVEVDALFVVDVVDEVVEELLVIVAGSVAVEDEVVLLDDETEVTIDDPLGPVNISLLFVAEHCHRTIERPLA